MADYILDDYLEDLREIQKILKQKLEIATDNIVKTDLKKVILIFEKKIRELENKYYKLGLKQIKK
ncbi:MAG: hypothetical protein HC831_09890 [Chloroflexia bacterium]|nr:hypothetical protein [Chloroflexia bacterium]